MFFAPSAPILCFYIFVNVVMSVQNIKCKWRKMDDKNNYDEEEESESDSDDEVAATTNRD